MSRIDVLEPPGVAPPGGLYSHASQITSGKVVLIAGQLAIDERGEIVGVGDFTAQMRQVFANLRAALQAAGATFQDVAKFTTFLTRDTDLAAFAETRKQLFAEIYPRGAYPPNTLLVVSRLVRPEFLIEIEAIAATGG